MITMLSSLISFLAALPLEGGGGRLFLIIIVFVMTPELPTTTIIINATTSFAPELMPKMKGPAIGFSKNV